MTYGTSNLDFGKIAVLISCGFPLFMTTLIAQDPLAVIASEQGGGWWDVLKQVSDDRKVAIYPRIWATSLVFSTVVRINWIFTKETAPALYRCVLMSYILPFAQYCLECFVFETLPPFDYFMAFLMMGPYLCIVPGYSKYTKEGQPVRKKKE